MMTPKGVPLRSRQKGAVDLSVNRDAYCYHLISVVKTTF